MRNIRLYILSVVTALGLMAVPLSATVHAGTFNAACGNAGASASAFCSSTTSGDPLTGPNGLIIKVTRIVAVFAGAVAVIIMIVAGLMYVISAGDAGKVARAKDTVIYAAVGLLVIVMGQTIIAFVVGKL